MYANRAGADSAPAMLTTRSKVPAVCAGAVTLKLVSLTTRKLAEVPPMLTLVVPSRWVPGIVNAVPPAVLPLLTLNALMVGAVTAE